VSGLDAEAGINHVDDIIQRSVADDDGGSVSSSSSGSVDSGEYIDLAEIDARLQELDASNRKPQKMRTDRLHVGKVHLPMCTVGLCLTWCARVCM
jgi:hypothetical protein